MSSGVISSIVSQHTEEMALLRLLRSNATHAPQYSKKDLARLDGCVHAHLDGLRVAGKVKWDQGLYSDTQPALLNHSLSDYCRKGGENLILDFTQFIHGIVSTVYLTLLKDSDDGSFMVSRPANLTANTYRPITTIGMRSAI